MQQTELTVQIYSKFEEINLRLKQLGFKEIEQVYMEDTYYSKFAVEELKTFSYKDIIKNSFLLRTINGTSFLIYKDKQVNENNEVISEEKLSTKITSPKDFQKIFDLAGLNLWCSLTQDMHIYKKGQVELAVQIVDGLGVFIEYEEDENVKGLSTNKKIDAMKNTLLSLGLKCGDDFFCKKPYIKLLQSN